MKRIIEYQRCTIGFLIPQLQVFRDLSQQEIIEKFSNGRTTDLTELRCDEATSLTQALIGSLCCEYLRDEIKTIADEMGLVNPNFPNAVLLNFLNKLIAENHISKSDFSYLSFDELVQLKKVFIAKKRKYNKSLTVKASNATKSLLKELNITTS